MGLVVFAYGLTGTPLTNAMQSISHIIDINHFSENSSLAQLTNAFTTVGHLGYVSVVSGRGDSIFELELNVKPVVSGVNINLTEDILNASAVAVATDANTQDAGHLVYSLSGVNPQDINNIVINSSSGLVTFTPYSDFQYLNDALHTSTGTDLSAVINFNVVATDSLGLSSSAASSVTVTGINDAADIKGQISGAVFEDNAGGSDVATGTLTVTDVDNPAGFQAVSTVTASANGYGSFTIDVSGKWDYQLDESNTTVDALNNGDILSDSFIVASTDGTQQQVNITINGHSDIPPPPALLAVAYISNDGLPGYDSNSDQLIASISDSNNDGHVSIGDTINFGVIPLDLSTNPVTQAFNLSATQITSIPQAFGPDVIDVMDSHGNRVIFFDDGVSGNTYDEFTYLGPPPQSSDSTLFVADIQDVTSGNLPDSIGIVTGTNSSGSSSSVAQVDPTDNVFLNVDILQL